MILPVLTYGHDKYIRLITIFEYVPVIFALGNGMRMPDLCLTIIDSLLYTAHAGRQECGDQILLWTIYQNQIADMLITLISSL